MRRPHELSDLTGYTKLALRYRQGMTAFPPPGPADLTGYAPMQYDRCGMTAAWGRRRIRCEVAKLCLAVKM